MPLRDPEEARRAGAQRNAIMAAGGDAASALSGLLRLTGLLVARGMLTTDDAAAVVNDITAGLRPHRGAEVRAAAANAIPGLFETE